MKYLIKFAQFHEDFRLPELKSLAEIENIDIDFSKIEYNKLSPYLVIELKNDEEAIRLIKRGILIKSVFSLWAEGKDYNELHEQVKKTQSLWGDYNDKRFKFMISSFGKSRTMEEQVAIINEFKYMSFNGKIDLKTPEFIFTVNEDFSPNKLGEEAGLELKYLYFGLYLANASRDVIMKYDLKKRAYLGTTSMDAELSLVMANMAKIKKFDLVYDPFVGTGSFLVTSAHFGGYTIGSDIDGRQVRGKGDKSIVSNIKQYKLENQILDTVVFDITNHPWRDNIRLDSIVTDPPYGVRAGAKKLGRKQGNRKLEDIALVEGTFAHLNKDYIPPKVNYDMPQVLLDLLNFAANYLKVSGRLVFWLPNVVEEHEEPEVPQHECLTLIADSEQKFYGWSRRLITMEKHSEPKQKIESKKLDIEKDKVFRNRYFQSPH